MPIDPLLIEDKLNFSKRYLTVLKHILAKSEDLFLEDIDLQLQGERIFEILSQIMLDICTHIVANSNVAAPKSYAECM